MKTFEYDDDKSVFENVSVFSDVYKLSEKATNDLLELSMNAYLTGEIKTLSIISKLEKKRYETRRTENW